MEKRNYVKPIFVLNSLKTTSFIAASVESGEGGLSCSDDLSEKVIEDIFYVNTGKEYMGDGDFNLDYFKEYLRVVGSANIKCGYIYRPTGVEIVRNGRKEYLNIGGMSFEKEACYTATLINNECIKFTQSGAGTNCSNYNFIIPSK